MKLYTVIIGYICTILLMIVLIILNIQMNRVPDTEGSAIVTETPVESTPDGDTYVYIPEDIKIIPRMIESDGIESDVIEEVNTYVPDVEDVNALARTLYGECRGISSDMEKAAVIWCILNRVDADIEDSIIDVITSPNQFQGYDEDNPLWDNLVELSKDVLIRWNLEHEGYTDVGRVLPSDYLYFVGDGSHNWFSREYLSTDYWDWSLTNPYGVEEN